MNYRKSIVFTTLLLNITLAFADCNDDSNNILQSANCDFSADVSGWTFSTGDSFNHDASDDFLAVAPGAANADAAELAGGLAYAYAINLCVAIPNDTSAKTVGGWYKGNTGATSECFVTSTFYEGSGCNLTNRGSCTSMATPAVISSANDWTNTSCDAAVLSGSVQSVHFAFTCNNGVASALATPAGDFSTKFDNAYIVPQGSVPVELKNYSVD